VDDVGDGVELGASHLEGGGAVEKREVGVRMSIRAGEHGASESGENGRPRVGSGPRGAPLYLHHTPRRAAAAPCLAKGLRPGDRSPKRKRGLGGGAFLGSASKASLALRASIGSGRGLTPPGPARSPRRRPAAPGRRSSRRRTAPPGPRGPSCRPAAAA